MTATTPEVGATRINFRKLNSSPSENISSTTPSSESSRAADSSAKSGMARCGPTSIPASR